jgi:phytanoyl-CoA hydroxylase
VFKPPGAANEVPWHQDFMYMVGDPDKLIVWVALDDCTEQNGCMRAIPGSHRRGLLPSIDVKGETHHRRTPESAVDAQSAVPLAVEAGSVIFFHQALLHSSARVSGEQNRRAFRFAVKSAANSYTPRATPILLSVSQPEALYDVAPLPRLGPLHRLVRRVGRRLKAVGAKLASV